MSRKLPFGRDGDGQSLVEMAIITPLLIFMMIGVFEVGWALRGYLVLVNANRETARFAVRPTYLNFETADDPGWGRVMTQALDAVAGNMPLNFVDKGTLVMAYIEVNTGDTGNPAEYVKECKEDGGAEDVCYTKFLDNCQSVYTYTIRTPAQYPTFTVTYGPTETTHFNYEIMAQDLAVNNREHNCRLAIQGGLGRADGLVIVEMWYKQPQLMGFPLISNPFTDPVPMYGHTIMRRIQALRGSGQALPTEEP